MKTQPKAPKRFFLQYQNTIDNLQSQRMLFFQYEPYLKLNFSKNTNFKKFRKGPASKLNFFFLSIIVMCFYNRFQTILLLCVTKKCLRVTH